MIAAVYARKSTEQNVADESKSVARQVEHARAYARQKGWTVNESCIFVDDGISGAEFARRPGFVRLMSSLSPPSFDVLVMSESSRLGREAWETGYVLKRLINAGVRVFLYLEDREVHADSPLEKLQFSMVQAFDEMERARASQRSSDKALQLARAGHVTGGRVFGYDNIRVDSHTERRINEAEAAMCGAFFSSRQTESVRSGSHSGSTKKAWQRRARSKAARPRGSHPRYIRCCVASCIGAPLSGTGRASAIGGARKHVRSVPRPSG
jgi:site-specific DNA recombinase